MNFKQFLLTEKLDLSTAKKYAKNWDKKRYSEWFGGKYRIYLPLKTSEGDKSIKIDARHIDEDVANFLDNHDLEIVDYKAGLVKNISKPGTENPDKRIFKLGSFIQKFITKLEKADRNKNSIYIESLKDILKAFINDPIRKGGKKGEVLVVISRHPYDIAGMSTDRGWHSCMNLHGGMYSRFCAYDIKEGTLIAYLINSDDKNINHPIGRLLIKPYINNSGEVYLHPSETVYGTTLPGFRETVVDWFNEKQQDIFGKFSINANLYIDHDKTDIDRTITQKALNNKLNWSGDLTIESDSDVWELPPGLTVKGGLFIHSTRIESIPEKVTVGQSLYASDGLLFSIARDLKVKESIFLRWNRIQVFPALIHAARTRVDLGQTPNLDKIEDGLTVGELILNGSNLTVLPNRLTVNGNLSLLNTKIKKLPDDLVVKGYLFLDKKSVKTLNPPEGKYKVTVLG